MDDDTESFFGAGTDLIVSLCALLLIAVAVLGFVFFERNVEVVETQLAMNAAIADARSAALNSGQLNEQLVLAREELASQRIESRRMITALEEEIEETRKSRDIAVAHYNSMVEANSGAERESERVRQEADDMVQRLRTDYERDASRLRSENRRLLGQIIELRTELSGALQAPQIVELNDREFRFSSGSYELSPEFRRNLRAKVQEIRRIAEDRNARIIEVVGHTDPQPVGGTSRVSSNLDRTLRRLANPNRVSRVSATAADNVGLGMLRAVAVAREIENQLGSRNYTVIPLSAGQLITTNGHIDRSNSQRANPQRRRLEIRVRQLPTRD